MNTPPPAGEIKTQMTIIFGKQHVIFMKTPPPSGKIKISEISENMQGILCTPPNSLS